METDRQDDNQESSGSTSNPSKATASKYDAQQMGSTPAQKPATSPVPPQKAKSITGQTDSNQWQQSQKKVDPAE